MLEQEASLLREQIFVELAMVGLIPTYNAKLLYTKDFVTVKYKILVLTLHNILHTQIKYLHKRVVLYMKKPDK